MNQKEGSLECLYGNDSTEVIHMLYAHCGTQLPIVGVGGISDVESAWEKITAHPLLQLYSALVFEGPGVSRAINKGLNQKLRSRIQPTE